MKHFPIIFALVLLAASASAQDSLKIISPNGGEKFYSGSDTVILWTGIPLTDTVKLEYSTNAGASWNSITDTATGGRYRWHVPVTVSDSCLVRAWLSTFSKSWLQKVASSVYAEGITMDSGNIYVAGQFYGSMNFAGTTLTDTNSLSNDADMFVARNNFKKCHCQRCRRHPKQSPESCYKLKHSAAVQGIASSD